MDETFFDTGAICNQQQQAERKGEHSRIHSGCHKSGWLDGPNLRQLLRNCLSPPNKELSQSPDDAVDRLVPPCPCSCSPTMTTKD